MIGMRVTIANDWRYKYQSGIVLRKSGAPVTQDPHWVVGWNQKYLVEFDSGERKIFYDTDLIPLSLSTHVEHLAVVKRDEAEFFPCRYESTAMDDFEYSKSRLNAEICKAFMFKNIIGRNSK